MKKIFIASLIILGVFLFFNCNKKSNINMNRNEYVADLKSQIDKWNIELDKLDENIKKFNGETKVKADAQLTLIRSKRDELNKNLEKILNSTDNAWEDLKNGAENAKDSINKALEKAQADFK